MLRQYPSMLCYSCRLVSLINYSSIQTVHTHASNSGLKNCSYSKGFSLYYQQLMENGLTEPDLGFTKDPLPAANAIILQNLGAADGQTAKDDSKTEEEGATTDDEEVPAELKKTYYFGCGPYYSKRLHWIMARKKMFTFLLCCYAFLQGAIVSGFTSVVLSTIQNRYNFSSVAAGFVAISYDITLTVSVIFVSYFGGKSHKPRWIGISTLLMSFGCFIFALPQFLFGEYGRGSLSSLYEGCMDNRSFIEDCSPSDAGAYTMFVIGNIFIAVGAAPIFTVAQAYLDEIVLPKYLSIHIGVYLATAAIGPAFGYLVGSSLLSVYVDPWVETTLGPEDPAWVGAWWLSFILAGIMCIFLAVPFLMFPRYLPDSAVVRKERAKEMAKIYSKKFANEDTLTVTVKMFPIHIKRLLLNPSFMLSAFGLAAFFILVSGLIAFAPKYFEEQFRLTATSAGLLSGGVAIASATIATLVGAFILYLTKMKGKTVILFCSILIGLSVLFSPGFLLHCSQPDIVGITYGRDGIDTEVCAQECDCISTSFEPVCGEDGLTYFSPCRAGCTTTFNDGVYSFGNCSCVLVNSTVGSVTDGFCETSCSALVPFILLLIVVLFLIFITRIPFTYFIMRVVADDQRSLALGLQSVIWRLFGTIPGPLIFGALFDVACLQWQDPCEGDRGNCWIHNGRALGIYSLSFGIPCLIIATCCSS
uniref:Solute carrier organic anion transporter family member n=1 Tax=Amphimedon queenslandica TaxID=400682 RepID=A0A1X7UB28_AMPQE